MHALALEGYPARWEHFKDGSSWSLSQGWGVQCLPATLTAAPGGARGDGSSEAAAWSGASPGFEDLGEQGWPGPLGRRKEK